MAKTTKLVGYGISFDMKLTGGVKTSDDFAYAAKQIEKSINKARNSVKQQELQVELLGQAYKKGSISTKEYEQQKTSLAYKELKRTEKLEKERRAVLGLDRQEKLLSQNRARRARTAGMAASGVSGLGMGGRAAGAARFLGGAAGMGPQALLLGAGFAGATVAKEGFSAFAKLESQIEGMKSLFGEPIAEQLTTQFRALSKTTILTNSQLIENAKTWASYGLTTEGLTDRLKRLGTVAGGNSEKFRALTIAFAQVNAQGKLMGQEKNQLINAGMSLQAVADAAGISMEDFADAMSNGEISAEHLNQALVNITSEGGMFAGYLEKQAETINGKITILAASWEEFLVALGESEKGPASFLIDRMISAAEYLKMAAEYWGGAPSEPKPGSGSGQYETRQAAEGRDDAYLLGKAGSAALRTGDAKKQREGVIEDMVRRSNFQMSYAEAARKYDESIAVMEANAEEGRKAYEKTLEEERKIRKKLAEKDKETIKKFEDMLATDISDEDVARKYKEVIGKLQTDSIKKSFEKDFRMFAPEEMEGPNLMEQMGAEADARKRDEDRLAAQKNKDEIEFQTLRKQLIQEDQREAVEAFRQREKDIAKQLQEERQLAQTPSVSGFQAGSTGEFEFLRQQRQKGETARAVERANEKAEKQREALANEKKQADLETQRLLRSIDGKIQDLNEKQNQFI